MELEMRERTFRSRGRGLSLIEALVTLALLSVVLLALAPLFTQSVNVNASSSQLSVGNSLAREKLEELLLYPSTDARLAVPSGTTEVTFPNDLPAWYNPKTGATSTAATSPGAGWFPYPYRRTYTVEPRVVTPQPVPTPATLEPVASTLSDESSYNALGSALAPYYDVKLVTVTVVPATGPFPGLKRTAQSAYVRYRNALPN
jgi:type II secretory pathway pseudopilin PulG